MSVSSHNIYFLALQTANNQDKAKHNFLHINICFVSCLLSTFLHFYYLTPLLSPRFGRQFKLYDRILPSQLLDVTDVIVSSPRQCVICGVLAEWECPECYGSHLQGLASTAYCSECLQRTHQHKQRRSHKQEKLEKPPGWSKQRTQPIPR